MKKRVLNAKSGIILIMLAGFLSGCAGISSIPPSSVYPRGVYHKVDKGETLWRIAGTYGVELNLIAEANRLSDLSRIDVGQLLLIPGASSVKEVGVSRISAKEMNDFIWPIKGKVISSFGEKVYYRVNAGIDIEAEAGDAIAASRSGSVVFLSEDFKGYGRSIIIDHGDGYSTFYAYNDELLVRLGDEVEQGVIIAKAGSTGRALNTSLHFEIRHKHIPRNPYYFLP